MIVDDYVDYHADMVYEINYYGSFDDYKALVSLVSRIYRPVKTHFCFSSSYFF